MSDKNLTYTRETFYFVLVVLATIVIYVASLFSVIGILLIISFLLITWCLHMYATVSIRKNGIQLSPNQFPEFYEQAQQMAEGMGLKETPAIFVIESGGLLNAFATKFGMKNMVVLYSDLFSLIHEQAEAEVKFILAHEFAHLKRKHVHYSWLLMPGLLLPFLGSAYSRACEFTCDRYATYIANDTEAAQRALTILAIGPKLYQSVNREAYLSQLSSEKGFYHWLDEISSSHPNLPRRIDHIKSFYEQDYIARDRAPIFHIILGFFAYLIAPVFILVTLSYVTFTTDIDWLSEIESSLAEYDTESLTPLMVAIIEQDYENVETYLMDGTNINETNADQFTALHIAVIENDLKSVQLLVEGGAEMNTMSDNMYSPLADAIYYEYYEITKYLLENGASVEDEHNSVEEALTWVYDEAVIELVESYQ